MQDEKITEIDLLQVFNFVWIRKISVVAITILMTICVIGISYLLTPIYQAKVVLAPVTPDMSSGNAPNISGQLGGLASMVGIGSVGASDESTINMAVFESRKFMREFIEENNLIKIIYAKKWDEQKQVWNGKEPTIWKAVNNFDSKIRTISTNLETGLVTLLIDWPDPEVAVRWAGKSVTRINKVLYDEFILESDENLAYLNEQLLVTQNAEMRDVLYALIQEQIKKQMLSSNSIYFAYKIVDPAEIPDEPFRPNRILFAVMGVIFGGIVGIIYAWIQGNKAYRKTVNES